jgi:hypothetical protein
VVSEMITLKPEGTEKFFIFLHYPPKMNGIGKSSSVSDWNIENFTKRSNKNYFKQISHLTR